METGQAKRVIHRYEIAEPVAGFPIRAEKKLSAAKQAPGPSPSEYEVGQPNHDRVFPPKNYRGFPLAVPEAVSA